MARSIKRTVHAEKTVIDFEQEEIFFDDVDLNAELGFRARTSDGGNVSGLDLFYLIGTSADYSPRLAIRRYQRQPKPHRAIINVTA